MQFVIDTHVHIYPFYRVEQALESILDNLSRTGGGATKIACLTERYDCNLYEELAASPRNEVRNSFSIESLEGSLLISRRDGEGDFYLLPGQQVITAENIEILSLNCLKRVVEGNSAVDTVRDILGHGGVPVIAWAPGKWFFNRGKVVRTLIDEFSPSDIALGDTALRPLGWGLPSIMKAAKRRGFKVLYGSDPLPFAGEELKPGTYVTLVRSDSDSASIGSLNPGRVLKNILAANPEVKSGGSRGSLLEVLARLYRNSRAPKPPRQIAN
jgi:hypothetical protein